MIRSILAAIDGSPRAAGVFAAASEIAEKFGSVLYLFRTVSIPPEIPPAAHAATDPLPALVAQKIAGELRALAGSNPRVRIEEPLVGVGQPAWRAILDAADRLQVDLIVMGSHGYSGLDHILGTTAGKVANHAHHNVLIIHAGTKRAPEEV